MTSEFDGLCLTISTLLRSRFPVWRPRDDQDRLVHDPDFDIAKTWRALEALVDQGKARYGQESGHQGSGCPQFTAGWIRHVFFAAPRFFVVFGEVPKLRRYSAAACR